MILWSPTFHSRTVPEVVDVAFDAHGRPARLCAADVKLPHFELNCLGFPRQFKRPLGGQPDCR
jgi:hypothetical protein